MSEVFTNFTLTTVPTRHGPAVHPKPIIKSVDMPDEMKQDAIECLCHALDKYDTDQKRASYIKREFDKKYGLTWHCFVGQNFGSFVSFEKGHFIYFYIGQSAVLLFKSG